jgi:diaminohydroxyphosphoribosylaminopyrimidine deaminase/5-amino-6-(5-phosphoribosylamino)uracil reductase
MDHEIYMQRCLHLAGLGGGNVHPNPLVGSVLVKDGVIIGEGFHKQFGAPHAEVNALKSVKDPAQIPGSTLYVSLEPCSHTGKTPPCTSFILKNGITNVVIAMTDPNPKVNGKGIALLRENGVSVTEHILEQPARFVNRRFITFQEKHRPYVVLKWAESADNYIGRVKPDGKPILISNVTSRILVHKWRTEEQAIMVGTRTALSDNPQLDARLWGKPDPVRIVLDVNLRLPETLKFFRKKGKAIVLNSIKEGMTGNIRYKKFSPGKNMCRSMLSALHDCGIVSVLIEGGGMLLNSFLKSGLWDECRVFKSPLILSNGIPAPVFPFATSSAIVDDINGDQLFTAYNNKHLLS